MISAPRMALAYHYGRSDCGWFLDGMVAAVDSASHTLILGLDLDLKLEQQNLPVD